MRLAKEQMNLKATIKQLQGVKNVSLHEAIPRGVHVCVDFNWYICHIELVIEHYVSQDGSYINNILTVALV